jgi:hypothetical protein
MQIHILKSKILTTQIFLIVISLLAFTVDAETYSASSSDHPVALVELYTSQGCSSCPPADIWLGNLESTGISNKQVVPLALHVDYWDYIGWKDQFAQKTFIERQYQYRIINHSSSVYTPQIMFNGEDIRGVSLGRSLGQISGKKAVVAFELEASTITNDQIEVKVDFKSIDKVAKNSVLILVLAENNLVGNIKAGENTGRTLKHHHVARVWKNLGKLKKSMLMNISLKKEWNRKNLELVAFVETPEMQIQQTLQLVLN